MLVVVSLLLVAMGLAAIYSVDLSRGAGGVFFKKQLFALGVGFFGLIAASLIHQSWYRVHSKHLYGLTLLVLVAVLLFGATIRGTQGWFVFGGFSFQPVELGKAAVILILAVAVAHAGRRFDRPLFFFGSGLLAALVMALVLLQPDLGSALIIGGIWFGLMLLVGTRRRYLLACLGAAALVAAVGWQWVLKPYQQDRILTFLNPERDALGAGYTITQATIAVGAGGWFGRGLGFGSQSQLRFLPEAQSDLIFAVIGEELGFAGVATLFILFGLLLWRLLRIVRRSRDDFAAAAVSGIALLFFFQLFINVGAMLGLLPLTGVTLPFVSYGGSSLVVNLLLIGIAESATEKKY